MPHIVASVATEPTRNHGGGPKRKAETAETDLACSHADNVVSATGGLEFFANKPNKACPTKVPAPWETRDVTQTSHPVDAHSPIPEVEHTQGSA